MEKNWKLLGVASGAIVVACQWQPPQSLLLDESRRLYESRRTEGPIATERLREGALEAGSAATLRIVPR